MTSNGRNKNGIVSRGNSHSGSCGNLYGYRPGYGTELCRAHLVGAAERIGNVMAYIVEIHPEDAAKAHAWTVPEGSY